MKLTTSSNANVNYICSIVEVTEFQPHPKADRLKLVNINGCIISVGIDALPGKYIYFPLECQIESWFLKQNNLYRDKTLNENQELSGFFENHGRVRCINLRGIASEGLILPISSLGDCNYKKGHTFDTVDGNILVKKYILKLPKSKNPFPQGIKSKDIVDKIKEDQFKFHIDTSQFKNNLFKFTDSNKIINVSEKIHGTSAVFSNLLVKRNLNVFDKIAKFININVNEYEYKVFCSSRRVIKDPELNVKLSKGYYDYDIWTLALESLKYKLNKGLTIYAEIVGYMPNGTMIQKGYDYGCEYLPDIYNYETMSPEEMVNKNLFKIYVYRITSTNYDGNDIEFNPTMMRQYCNINGLNHVPILYDGTIENYISSTVNVELMLMEKLTSDYVNGNCTICKNKVPREGVVVRLNKFDFEAYKLKSLEFYQRESKELDEGEINIENE